jgi:arylsulfatase A-like enzyme
MFRHAWIAPWLAACAASGLCAAVSAAETAPAAEKPNIVIIFCDDLGYGDLACYGHPTIRTPNLDRMAAEGQRWTDFYAAECVCTPSRAALLTGRLPIRSGMCSDTRRVLFPDSAGGLPADEITIAEVLRSAGYATACVGKWHLGHGPQHLPAVQGFDSYFGIPYSNDMDRVPLEKGLDPFQQPRSEFWNVPLLRDGEVVERPADQQTITRRYTEEAVRLVRENRSRPFFLYLAHNMPHVPLFASEPFDGRSSRGLYGDVVEELDWSVGRVLDTLRELQLDRRTLVVFTSDNGPWLTFRQQGGSAGLLRDGKGSTWEGGMREPALFWWPGTIRPDVIREMGSTLDLLPTCAALAGVKPHADRPLDGGDLSPILRGTGPSPRNTMFYYRGTRLFAVRKGPFKAHLLTQPGYGPGKLETHDPPLLYHLGHDPGEQHDVASQYPEALAEILRQIDSHRANLLPGKPQLDHRL